MEERPIKRPMVAATLSGLMPGLGQFYVGEWKKGLAFLIGAIVADAAFGASAGLLSLVQNLLTGTEAEPPGNILIRSLPLIAIALWSIWDVLHTLNRQPGRL